MRIRLASLVLAVVLIFSLGGTSAFAHPGSDPKTPVAETKPASTSRPSATNETRPDEKLRGDFRKLVADARAGKLAPRGGPQLPQSKRNNLSTGAKIGIAAAIGGAIFLIILFHDLSKD